MWWQGCLFQVQISAKPLISQTPAGCDITSSLGRGNYISIHYYMQIFWLYGKKKSNLAWWTLKMMLKQKWPKKSGRFLCKNSNSVSVGMNFQLNVIQQMCAGNREETLKNTQEVTETSWWSSQCVFSQLDVCVRWTGPSHVLLYSFAGLIYYGQVEQYGKHRTSIKLKGLLCISTLFRQ